MGYGMFSMSRTSGGWVTGCWDEYPADASRGLIHQHGRFHLTHDLMPSAVTSTQDARGRIEVWIIMEAIRQDNRQVALS
jgi:hypothetical protein